jgi:serine/threonine-protein kinase
MDNLLGKRLDGRYQITELIGAGGMANVYKAADLLENRTVAVKVLREEFLDNEELVRRFKNESKAISLLSHPNIVKVFDVNFSSALQYIVMEFIDGITLKQYIDSVKPLGWKDAVHFTVQVLRALQHAHDRGIVHRDIKPQNIMLVADGSIKVMDFGIARFSRSETRTITDKAIGSVHYISPEQAKGDITDSKADLYSAGVMLYEMLTGKLPFESDTPVQVAIKQISDEPKRPREIMESIPEGLEEITLKAMAKDPAKRYQSAAQMLRDIDDFKKNPSIVFAYKYFSADAAATKYIGRSTEGIKSGVRKAAPGGDPAKRKKKGQKRAKVSTYLALGIVTACVACTVVMVLFMMGMFEGRHDDVILPDFRDKKSDEIISDPAYENFKFKTEEDYNKEKEPGVVYDQRPAAGKMVKDNSEVTLFVSKGGEQVTLPNVIGSTSGEAKKILKSLGVTVNTQVRTDPSFQANIVLGMSPEPESKVETGSEVIIYVNVLQNNYSNVEVPNLVGKQIAEAYDELDKSGLRRGQVTQVPDSAPKGTVISQSETPGSKVPIETVINLTVSSGPVTQTYAPSFAPPSPPVVNGVNQPYNIVVAVDGGHHQTIPMTGNEISMVTISPVTVYHENTSITISLSYNGYQYQYIEYIASNTRSECRIVSGPSSPLWVLPASGAPAGIAAVAPERRRRALPR